MAAAGSISDAAAKMLQELESSSIALPDRENLPYYRRDTRTRYMP